MTRKARAVQNTASTTTDATAGAVRFGRPTNGVNGAYTSAARINDAVTTPIDGRSES